MSKPIENLDRDPKFVLFALTVLLPTIVLVEVMLAVERCRGRCK